VLDYHRTIRKAIKRLSINCLPYYSKTVVALMTNAQGANGTRSSPANSFTASLEVKLFKDSTTLYDTITINNLVFPDECLKPNTDSYIGRVVASAEQLADKFGFAGSYCDLRFAGLDKNVIPSMYYGGEGYVWYVLVFVLASPQYADAPIENLRLELRLKNHPRTVTPYTDNSGKSPMDNIGLFPVRGWINLLNKRDLTQKILHFSSNPKLEFDSFAEHFGKEAFVKVSYNVYLNESKGFEVLFTYQAPEDVPDYEIATYDIKGCNYYIADGSLTKGYGLPQFHNLVASSLSYELRAFPVDLLRSVHSKPQVQIAKDSTRS